VEVLFLLQTHFTLCDAHQQPQPPPWRLDGSFLFVATACVEVLVLVLLVLHVPTEQTIMIVKKKKTWGMPCPSRRNYGLASILPVDVLYRLVLLLLSPKTGTAVALLLRFFFFYRMDTS
jgi:hypothetical protein